MSEDRRMPPRYGFDVNGYARQMYDGYWTPWHIAKDEITALRAEVERQRQQLAYLGGTVEVLSLSEQKLNAQLSARDAEVRALRETLGQLSDLQRQDQPLRAIAHAAAVFVRVEDSTARTMSEWQLAFDLLRTAVLAGAAAGEGEG